MGCWRPLRWLEDGTKSLPALRPWSGNEANKNKLIFSHFASRVQVSVCKGEEKTLLYPRKVLPQTFFLLSWLLKVYTVSVFYFEEKPQHRDGFQATFCEIYVSYFLLSSFESSHQWWVTAISLCWPRLIWWAVYLPQLAIKGEPNKFEVQNTFHVSVTGSFRHDITTPCTYCDCTDGGCTWYDDQLCATRVEAGPDDDQQRWGTCPSDIDCTCFSQSGVGFQGTYFFHSFISNFC